VPSVNGYVAFFDVSVSPSKSNEEDDDDDHDEDDDDEGEAKEEEHDDDEEKLAFRFYLFFSRSPLFDPLLLLSVLSLAIQFFRSCFDAR